MVWMLQPNINNMTKNGDTWTVEDVGIWLTSVGLESAVATFRGEYLTTDRYKVETFFNLRIKF